MRDPLAPLLADGVIDEVVGKLKSGKEAELWLVRHAGELLAAKVYKDREVRSFRNNAAYTEGRRVRDTRTQRAIARGSRFGRAADEDAWKAREADALHTLYASGVRVPKPHLFYEGVLLMELVVDARGHPAPRLIDAPVPRGAAGELFLELRRQVIAMLCCDLVHADLSAYNVLLGRAGPVVIDFPQVVGAAHNNQAERFLRRDLENLRTFLAQHDPALRARAGDAHEIWRAYVRRELTPDFVPPERSPAPPPRSRGHGPRGAEQAVRGAEHRGRPTGTSTSAPPRSADRTSDRAPQRQRQGGPSRHGQRQPEVIHVGRAPATAAAAGTAPGPAAHAGAHAHAHAQGHGQGKGQGHGHREAGPAGAPATAGTSPPAHVGRRRRRRGRRRGPR